MAIFTRMCRLLQATLHEALARAEDPVLTLNALLLEQSDRLAHTREATAVAMAGARRWAEQAAEATRMAQHWAERARMAAADDVTAALWHQHTAEDMARHYRQLAEQQARTVAHLRASLADLAQRLRETRMLRERSVPPHRHSRRSPAPCDRRSTRRVWRSANAISPACAWQRCGHRRWAS